MHNKFSVKYYLNLVLVDEEDRRYFKQQEIQLCRQTDTAASEGTKDISQVGFLYCLSPKALINTALGRWSLQPSKMLTCAKALLSKNCVWGCFGCGPQYQSCPVSSLESR